LGQAIAQILLPAVGVGLSPIPVVAVIVMLGTPRARVNGPAFVAGWLIGLATIGVFVLGVANPSDASDNGQPATWVDWLKLVLGLLLLVVALREWRGRPRGDDEPVAPKWMGAVDGFSPVKSLGAGVVLSAANPKNLLLALAAATSIAETGIPEGQQAIAYAVFEIIACVGVVAPVLIYFALGDQAPAKLAAIKGWMARNNAVIMAVLCLAIGVKLVGDAIAGFSS
jgi:threonine/homoserine/homoserine lactone efflux protein